MLRLASYRLSPGEGGECTGGILPLIEHTAPVIELLLTCQPVFRGRFHGIGERRTSR